MKKSLRDKIVKLTNQGMKPAEIAKATGASLSYVYVIRSKYKKQVPKHILKMLSPAEITPIIKDPFWTRLRKLFGV